MACPALIWSKCLPRALLFLYEYGVARSGYQDWYSTRSTLRAFAIEV